MDGERRREFNTIHVFFYDSVAYKDIISALNFLAAFQLCTCFEAFKESIFSLVSWGSNYPSFTITVLYNSDT